jgi:glutathione peroxidase
MSPNKSIYDFAPKTIDGQTKPLSEYRGRAMLVVNVATRCSTTRQYAGLEELYEAYAPRGLSVLGFPADEFITPEPSTDAEIMEACTTNFGVKFDMFSRVKVRGEQIDPLFEYLTRGAGDSRHAGDITMNFTKFLVGKNGIVVARFGPHVHPTSAEIREALEKALAE